VDGPVTTWARGARVRRDGRFVHVRFVPQKGSPPEDEAFGVACVALESLVGEATMARSIGTFDVDAPGLLQRWFGTAAKNTQPLAEVRDAVEREIESIRGELPSVPRAQHDDGTNYAGTVYRVDGPPPENHRGTSDVMVATYLLPDLFEATRRPRFFSTSFSRCGETFCYVKFDPAGALEAPQLVARFEAIDAALRDAAVGCAVGRAFGHRYGYVDVAVTNVARAVEVLRGMEDLPKRAWLLFHDCELLDEWIGIRDDAAPPPGTPG